MASSLTISPKIERFGNSTEAPDISVIILNYNGEKWLAKCFESLQAQSLLRHTEIIFADNSSTDNSVALARQYLAGFPIASLVHNGGNLGFCAGNNVPARTAKGEFLFFLNPDAWVEPDCLQKLLAEVRRNNATAATPWILNYADDSHQDLGFFGFDLFGLPSPSRPSPVTREVFIAAGCAFFMRAQAFAELGGFDEEFFMYSDEVDLSWRTWITGGTIIGVPQARVHHRGAAAANPEGGAQTVEFRTNDKKRFLSNRNNLLTLLKSGQHLLLLTLIPLLFLFIAETLFVCLLLRRASFLKLTLAEALKDCWRLRHHIRAERRKLAARRKRSDFGMLRFFRWRLNRWFEIKRLFHFNKLQIDR